MTIPANLSTPPSKPEREWFSVPEPGDTGTGRFLSWSKVPVGTEVTGKWLGVRDGEYGPIGAIELPGDRVQRFALPKILLTRLSIVDPGVDIKIIYLGTQVSKKDVVYHTFEVLSSMPIMLPGAAEPKALAPGSDDDVPF